MKRTKLFTKNKQFINAPYFSIFPNCLYEIVLHPFYFFLIFLITSLLIIFYLSYFQMCIRDSRSRLSRLLVFVPESSDFYPKITFYCPILYGGKSPNLFCNCGTCCVLFWRVCWMNAGRLGCVLSVEIGYRFVEPADRYTVDYRLCYFVQGMF